MRVVATPEALGELADIWDYNAESRGTRRADGYLAFLMKSIASLRTNHPRGRRVETRPDLRYVLMRRKSQGHGHIAVYFIEGTQVTVVHIFHTAQDWQTRLVDE